MSADEARCCVCDKQIMHGYEIEDRGELWCIACWEKL